MPHKVLMPALSPTMTEGKLAKWLKNEGDAVKAGQVIAEIETDKATMEVEAVDEGVLAKIVIPAGTEGVAVNSLIAVLLEEGEDASAVETAIASGGGIAKTVTPANTPAADVPAQQMTVAPVAATPVSTSAAASGTRIVASPLAKRVAKQRGIDLAKITGSGPRGRIVVADLDKAPAAASKTTAAAGAGGEAQAIADAFGIPYELQPHSGVRKVIAKRLTQSKQTVPHFYLTVDCELDALLSLRKQLNDGAEDFRLSVNDFIIKATAAALKKIPAANVSWSDDNMVQYTRADVSVAVATDGGLITPIIKDAGNKNLKQISNEMKDLAARARDGKLKPEEFQGGTISVSNLGMFGIKSFSAIINPPQGAILAVGAGAERVVVRKGEIKIVNMMTVTASFDHRAIDGAVGAEFIAAFKHAVEHPMGLIL